MGQRLARIDFTSQRLYLAADLSPGVLVELDRAQSNYLVNVLRFSAGDALLVFNGRDGEWRATLDEASRKATRLRIVEAVRPQSPPGSITYAFAPLKHARLDYMVQKAVEMGACRLQPVLTQHTQAARLNLERMQANVIEAAEQCGVLAVPDVGEPMRFDAWLAQWPASRPIVFCDEDADVEAPVAALMAAREKAADGLGLIVGPEGGFSAAERAALLARPETVRLSLGPRILRADTAAVAALAVLQAVLGDWQRR